MFTVSADFMGDFKLGDNINHNLKIIRYFYERESDPHDGGSWLLRKPTIIILASICEAVLHDLHMRMNTYTNEGVKGVAISVINYVRGKKIDKFEAYISSARKHGLLGPASEQIYSDLEDLRKLRNRVHIQNDKDHFEANDSQAFSADRVRQAEQALEKLVKTISTNHPREAPATGHVGDFEFPWNEHYR